jgi:hypothetical protein
MARAGRRSAVLLCTAVAGLALLSGCAVPDLREPGTGAGGAEPRESSLAPKAPLPAGKPLDSDARVPDPGVVDEDDATAVAEAWAEVTYGYDTAYDTSPHDAVLRGLRWCTERRSAAEKKYRPAAGSGHEWSTWAEHRAWTTPDVTIETVDDSPPDGETIAYRSLVVEATAQGRDGWTGTGPRLNAYVKLVRAAVGKPWQVDDATVVEAVAPPEPDGAAGSGASASSSSSSSSDDSTQ